MKKIQSILKGENLTRYLNIQETIRQTRRTISMSVSHAHQRQVHEDILPIAGSKRDLDGSVTSSSSGKSLFTTEDEDREEKQRRKADIESAYKKKDQIHDKLRAKSDYMLDELKATTKGIKDTLPMLPEESPCHTMADTIGSSEEKNLEQTRPQDHVQREIDMRLYDQLTPEEEKIICEQLSSRYGKESGRRYLLVRSTTAPEKKIREVTKRKSTDASIYGKAIVECQKTGRKPREVICPEMSEEVTQKMKTLLDMKPSCDSERIQQPKKWKDVLKGSPEEAHRQMMHMSIKGSSPSTSLTSVDEDCVPCTCGLDHCDCHLVEETCDPPEVTKKCDTMDHEFQEINNFLVTCRENLKARQKNDLRISVLQQHAVKTAQRVTRESVYLQSAHNQAQNELMACLMSIMPPQGQEVSDEGFAYVQQMANVISEHRMINEREWRIWRHSQARQEHEDNSDEVDSLDSDFESSASSDDESKVSECDIKFSPGIHPSRIPYFKETFELANILFEKIDAKMERIINKNHDMRVTRMKKPYSYQLREKFKKLRDASRLFNQISKKLNSEDFFSKKLIPFSEQKRRKRVRAHQKKVELNRKQNIRKLIEGIQLGKKYRKPRRSFLYTEQENYRGFSLCRQKILQKPGADKFRKCNLAGKNLARRKLTKKVIHQDYRLIRSLFDDQLKVNKESLWDPGMKARLEEFSAVFKEKHEPTAEEEEEYEGEVKEHSSNDLVRKKQSRRPVKEELQKTQSAQPNCWSYCTKSSANASEVFASMIRSLRTDARSYACPISGNCDNLSEARSSRMQTATSIGKTTVRSRSFEPVSEWPIKKAQRTSGFRLSRLDKPQLVPSSQLPTSIKGRPCTPGSFMSVRLSDNLDNLSEIQSSQRRTRTSTGKTTIRSGSFEPALELPTRRAQRTSGFGSSRLAKLQPVSPSLPRSSIEGRPYVPGRFMSFGLSDTDKSVPQVSHLKRPVLPRNLPKSLPPIHSGTKPNVGDTLRKPLWKSPRTVR